MRLNGYSGSSIMEWESQVWINGRTVDGLSWSVKRDLTGMPGAPTTASNGATGTLKPVDDRDVLDYALNPWTRVGVFPPKGGWEVKIEQRPKGSTGPWVRVFTGQVDDVSGDDFANLEVSITDVVDPFENPVSVEPLHWQMPPPIERATGPYRELGLHPFYYVNRAFEAAGYTYMLPRRWAERVRVPLVGSVLPDAGADYLGLSSVYTGNEGDMRTSHCADFDGPGMDNFTATYPLRYWPGEVISSVTDQTFIHRVAKSNTANYIIRLRRSTWSPLITVYAGGKVRCQIFDSDGNSQGLVELAPSEVGTLIAVTTDGNGALLTLSSTVNGQEIKKTLPWLTKVACETVEVSAMPGAYCGGFSLNDGATIASTNWTPNAVLKDFNFMPSRHWASPPIFNIQAKTLLDRIATAQVCHWGIDEMGRAVWRSAIAAVQSTVTKTVSDDEILDHFSWSSKYLNGASMIQYNTMRPNVMRRRQPDITCYKGSAQTVAANQSVEEFIHTPDGEDWIGVDLTGETGVWASGTVGWGSTKDMQRTRFIASKDNGSGDPVPATWDEYSATLERLDWQSYKLTHKTASASVTTKAGPWTYINPAIRNSDMPLIRCAAMTRWSDWADFSPSDFSQLPVFTVDAGEWGSFSGPQVCTWLSDMLRGEQVELDDVSVVPDLELQVGDKVRLDLTQSMKVVLEVVITSLTHEMTAEGGAAMKASIRVTKGTVPVVTYEMLEAGYSAAFHDRYQELEGDNAGKTYAQFESAPLAGLG